MGMASKAVTATDSTDRSQGRWLKNLQNRQDFDGSAQTGDIGHMWQTKASSNLATFTTKIGFF
jgi:hypothetical protein